MSGLPLIGNPLFTRGQPKKFFMPDEGETHLRTWMGFVANEAIWSRTQIPRVKEDLALIANTIAKYEPVSILLSGDDLDDATSLLDIASSNYPIELIECELDDLWLRDTGATFVRSESGEKFAIDFSFNGWGEKQRHSNDKLVANFMAEHTGVASIVSRLVLEGGCFEVDGKGTAIMTKSCIANDNRNPGMTLAEIETELKRLLGLRKIIWLEGVKGMDITDGHTDFYARFAHKAEVVVSRDNYAASFDYEVTRENIEILRHSRDADNTPLQLHIINTPDFIDEQFGSEYFAAGYIGYYLCNGAVIAQKFGDKSADEKALATLKDVYPNRTIEQLSITGIASGGGSIHCATQQEII
ncbi:MAG: agmatine deiminase family protein [Pseudomonadota bacterium]